jgi:hypothetical protein
VGATISFRWDALDTARSHTREEDLLAELFGPDEGNVAYVESRLTVSPESRS